MRSVIREGQVYDDDFISPDELDIELNTVSGALDDRIQGKPDNFIELDDTLNSFVAQGEKLLFVNSSETGIVCSGIIDGGYF